MSVANQYGDTALMKVAAMGQENIVKLLLSNGADKDLKNEDGQTAEYLARDRGYKDLANIIREYRPEGLTKPARIR